MTLECTQASSPLGQDSHSCDEWRACQQSLSPRMCCWRYSCCKWTGEESGKYPSFAVF